MSSTALSPYRLGKARELYNLFNIFNAISWQFLAGNVITLFALKLDASSTYIGALNAILYIAFFFLPMGKMLLSRFSIIKIYSTAWILRSIGMTPLLFAVVAAYAGRPELALSLILLGAMIFHVSRGIGMIGNNPVISFLAAGPDRGSYMTQIQISAHAVGMFGGFLTAMLLGRNPPLFFYAIIFSVGIVSGVIGGTLLKKVPEPAKAEEDRKPKKFSEVAKLAMSNASLKQFISILFLVALVSGVSRIFLVVYAREVFFQNDGMVSLYAVFAGLGALMIGMMVKFLVDRIGAKPIFNISIIIGIISLIPVIFISPGISETTIVLFLTFLFFAMNFGFLGAEGIAQTYFLNLVPEELMMDMGILYFFCFAVAGTAGSFLGGVFLDLMTVIGFSSSMAFRFLYIVLIFLACLILVLQRKMVPLGAIPFKDALEVIFSYRDLKAISLLDKLSKNVDSQKEEELLEALYDSPSSLAIKGLLNHIKSPKLTIRIEALRAIGALKDLDANVEKALTDDILNNPFTTAYYSASIMGNHRVLSAIPLLREMINSDDYMLAGESFIALAKLGDHPSRIAIEKIVSKTKNPRLKIMGVEALGIYRSPNSLTLLLDILKGANPPPYLRDEVTLSMSNILDNQNQFYSLLVRFLADKDLLSALAMDEAESAYEYYVSVHGRKIKKKDPELLLLSNQAKDLEGAVAEYIKNYNGSLLSLWIHRIPDYLAHTVVQVIISEAVLDNEFNDIARLRLLIVNWCARELRNWTKKAKERRGGES